MKQTTEKTRLLFATAFCFFFYFAQSVARGVYGTLSPFLIDYYDKTSYHLAGIKNNTHITVVSSDSHSSSPH